MDARSKLDILYAEILGDVESLTARLEAVSREVADATAALDRAPGQIRTAVQQAGPHMAEELRRASATAQQDLSQTTHDLGTNAASIQRAATRTARLCLVIGMASGAVGGALAGLALGTFLF